MMVLRIHACSIIILIRLSSLVADLASSSASDGDALTLDLRDPVLRALLRQLRLVVLVEGAADELVATDRLGVLMVVAIRRPRAHDRRALLLEARGELVPM